MKQIFNIAKYIGTIAGACAVIWGAYSMFDNIRDSQEDIIEKVEYINIEQTFMAEDISNINDTLKNMEDKIDDNSESLSDLYRAGKFYLDNQEQYTKEQLEQIMDEILKKNTNLTTYSPTLYPGPD